MYIAVSLKQIDMKNLNREDLVIAIDKKFPKVNCMRTESFDGSEGGIWISGEDDITDKNGKQLFSYYNDNTTYEFGILKSVAKFLEARGWHGEWYDAGTLMLWES